jgi:hypothetical protein
VTALLLQLVTGGPGIVRACPAGHHTARLTLRQRIARRRARPVRCEARIRAVPGIPGRCEQPLTRVPAVTAVSS